jgi:type I restriction enzyme S subunit
MTATGIKSAKLKEIPVPVPPLEEQHCIVTKVNELLTLCDSLKANLNQTQTTQTQLADAIVKQAVN